MTAGFWRGLRNALLIVCALYTALALAIVWSLRRL
jgi:hypothetical protein